jgi:hypothetical protein
VIFIDHLKEQLVIRQQIALNHKMYEAQKISKLLHHRTHQTLINRLTKITEGIIVSHGKVN